MNHTPGPWYAVGYYVETESDDKPDICTCNPASMNQGHLAYDEYEICANVCLIAAAPDLLAACEALMALNSHWWMEADGIDDDIRAAIAKARGITEKESGK